jgi:Protein of unknown function (DUF3624).
MTSKTSQKRCCGEIDLSQIGSCMHCLVLAATLTFLSWIGFVLVTKNVDLPWLSGALLIFSCLFSLLLLTHAIASFVRKNSTQTIALNLEAHPFNQAGTTSRILNK